MIFDGAALSLNLFGEALDPAAYLSRFYPPAPVPPIEQVAADAAPLVARVHHGIWTAACPCTMERRIESPGGVVFFAAPFVWCICCWNVETGGNWRPVMVPSPEQRRGIEAVLGLRPNMEDRNWEVTETVADLVAQNREHGDPVPGPDDLPPAVAVAPDGPRWPSDAARMVLDGLRRRPRAGRLLGR